MEVPQKNRVIFDPIYGFIQITPVEWEIIHSPFYQRLRWIKQLGFSCYLFPGAEHSRFGHSIGVMYNAHRILQSCGKGVTDRELLEAKPRSEEAQFHQTIRLAALMHDLGTFPFSHTSEGAYITFGETHKKNGNSDRQDDHEHLGSFIIKNTDYESGITHILKKHGIDPQKISDLVKGTGPVLLANQVLHSEVDCDRMDYLLRDAHYTGLKYGSYDRDYLLFHFKVAKIGGQEVLTIKHNALHCVEDFLMSRFAWYSQVIRSPRGARYDAIAEELTLYMLEKGEIYRYSDLLEMIQHSPKNFYMYNDLYFMQKIHALYVAGKFDKSPKMREIAEMILFERPPQHVRLPEFTQRLLNQDELALNEKMKKRGREKVAEIQDYLKKKGGPNDWIVTDIPKKNITFVMSYKKIVKSTSGQNVLLTRDPAKISYDNGEVKLLAEVENSIISRLQDTFNSIPNVFCSVSAYELLKQAGLSE